MAQVDMADIWRRSGSLAGCNLAEARAWSDTLPNQPEAGSCCSELLADEKPLPGFRYIARAVDWIDQQTTSAIWAVGLGLGITFIGVPFGMLLAAVLG